MTMHCYVILLKKQFKQIIFGSKDLSFVLLYVATSFLSWLGEISQELTNSAGDHETTRSMIPNVIWQGFDNDYNVKELL